MKALLIAEKPSVSSAIQQAYNKIAHELPYQIDFVAAAGHLVSLCEPDEYCEDWALPPKREVLPMIPEQFKLKVTNPEVFNRIKKQLNSTHYDLLINACDQGREGFLIFHLITAALGCNLPVLRFWAEDVTEKTCINALKSMKDENYYKGYIESGYLRLYLDWLTGMNFSRSASLSLEYDVAMGRVMTAVLAMVVGREAAITNFKPTDYKTLTFEFQHKNGKYKGTLINPNKIDKLSKTAFLDQNILKPLTSMINSNATISDVQVKDTQSFAPSLFNLVDLQKECSKRYKFTPSKTLKIAQSLYEKKLLSYPRTESRYLNNNIAQELKSIFTSLCEVPELNPFLKNLVANYDTVKTALSSKRYVNDAKVFDHPALTVTYVKPDFSKLTQDETNVYGVVFKRLVAIFFPPNINTKTVITTTLPKDNYIYNFESTGTVIKQLGWKALYKVQLEKDKDIDEQILPQVKVGENAITCGYKINDKQTTPPSRFTDATILSAMESAGKYIDSSELTDEQYAEYLVTLDNCAGLGTAATRAAILDKLFARHYLEKQKSYIHPTLFGTDLINALNGYTSIISPAFTAEWEQSLNMVERGEMTYVEFTTKMNQFVFAETNKLLTLKKLTPRFEPVGTCPKCSRDVIKLKNFFACSGYFEEEEDNKCDLIIPRTFCNKALSNTDISKLLSGQQTQEYSFKKKSGKSFRSTLTLKDGKICTPPVAQCPICKSDVFKGKGYFCVNSIPRENKQTTCNFSIFAKIGDTDIPISTFREILQNGVSKNELKIKGLYGDYKAQVTIDMSSMKFIKYQPKPEYICKCPACYDGNIFFYGKSYKCTNHVNQTGCNLQLPASYMSASITSDDIKTVCQGNVIQKIVTTNNNKTFTTKLSLKNDDERGWCLSYK